MFRGGSRTLKEARDYCQVCNFTKPLVLQRIPEQRDFFYGADVQFGVVVFLPFYRVLENLKMTLSPWYKNIEIKTF